MGHKDKPIKTSPIHNKDCVHDFSNEIQASDEQRARFNKMILESSIPVKMEEHNTKVMIIDELI